MPKKSMRQRTVDHYRDLDGGGRATVIAALISLVSSLIAALIGLIVALVPVFVDDRGTSAPSASASTNNRTPTTPANPTDGKLPAQGSSLGGCRGAVNIAHAPVTVNPCINVINDQLALVSHVVALQSGKITVFVWLTDGNTYRPNVSPHRCTFDLVAGQVAVCSTRVRPDRPGTQWMAATSAEAGWADLPGGWYSFPSVAGTQSGYPVVWPLQK
jgi:hypothetical protein